MLVFYILVRAHVIQQTKYVHDISLVLLRSLTAFLSYPRDKIKKKRCSNSCEIYERIVRKSALTMQLTQHKKLQYFISRQVYFDKRQVDALLILNLFECTVFPKNP